MMEAMTPKIFFAVFCPKENNCAEQPPISAVYNSLEEAQTAIAVAHLESMAVVESYSNFEDATRFCNGQLLTTGPFYGVLVPNEPNQSGVFSSRDEALRTVKTFKSQGARFYNTATYAEARKFADGDSVIIEQNTTSASRAAEEDNIPFPAPGRDAMIALKRSIEKKDVDAVQQVLLSNPRFLINVKGGDCPTLVMEGPRYNAMHLAASAGCVDIGKLILQLIDSAEYIHRLYPEEAKELNDQRRALLRTCYLTIRDKVPFNTPLHFAVKKKHADFVRWLLKQPECDVNAQDKHNETALHMAARSGDLEIIDLLCANQDADRNVVNNDNKRPCDIARETWLADDPDLCRQIQTLLTTLPWYVYLLRDSDFQRPPRLELLTSRTWSADCNGDISSAKEFVAAVVGPCSSVTANSIRTQWSSRKNLAGGGSRDLKRTDVHKGMERIGRRLAALHGVPWTEYWSFLDEYCDLGSPRGLSLLEAYLSRMQITDKLRWMHLREEQESSSPYSPASARYKTRRQREKDQNTFNGSDSLRRALGKTFLQMSGGDDVDSETDTTSDVFCDSFSEPHTSPNDDDLLALGSQLSELNCSDTAASVGKKVDRSQSDEAYITPPDSPQTCYLVGWQPTKVDLDAYHAVEGVHIRAVEYPNVQRWYEAIKFYNSEERDTWPSLDSPRAKTYLSKAHRM